MASNPQVHRLLKERLEWGTTPEEVCGDSPELLLEVRQRWQQFQRIDAQVRSLLPGLGTDSDAGTTGPPVAGPPQVPGYEVEPVAGLPQVPGYEVEAVLGRGGM